MTEKMTLAGFLGHSALARWAPIPLRLIVGYGFMQRGFAKLLRGADGSRQFFTRYEFPRRTSWCGPAY